MDRIVNEYCLPQDAQSWKEGVGASLAFEFIIGAETVIPEGHSTNWRRMPFHMCCVYPDADRNSICARLEEEAAPAVETVGGEGFFLPAWTMHRIINVSGKPLNVRWMHFRCRAFPFGDVFDYFDLPRLFHKEGAINAELEKLIKLPQKLSLQESIRQQSYGAALVTILLEGAREKRFGSGTAGGARRLAPALRFLEEHPEKNPSCEELAALVNLSVSRFRALFHEVTGTAPHRFLETVRFKSACRKLIEEESPLAEIAQELGYCDVYHFSRAFRRASGVPPGAFRKHPYLIQR